MVLYCVNPIFDIDSDKSINLEKIIAWPHYMLKELYSSERIMFGKFWIGEETMSEIYDVMLPIPDINFISIRTAVTDRDPVLLANPELADKIINSTIIDKNMNMDFFEKDIPTDIDILMKSGYYEYLKNKFTKILRSNKDKNKGHKKIKTRCIDLHLVFLFTITKFLRSKNIHNYLLLINYCKL